MNGTGHAPVLLQETLAKLQVRPDGLYLDATFGRGGHAQALLAKLGPAGRLCVVDRDPEAIAAAQARFGTDERVTAIHGRFGDLERLLVARAPAAEADRKFDGILFDFGVSSPQLDDAARGFSFLRDGPLDMRMDPGAGMSAAQWLAQAPEKELSDVIYTLGEERFSRRIARAIVQHRQKSPLTRTAELAALIADAIPTREHSKHPATRTFQAIRMHVNGELAEIDAGLHAALRLLAPGGRLCAISFHSLEDRAVKLFLRKHATVDPVYAGLPHIPPSAQPQLRIVGKAIRATEEELAANPRARSATLRVGEKLQRQAS